MTTPTLPEPLSPPDCDLHGLEYMPMYGVKLFGSEFYAKANDAEFRALMKLLWVSWTQVPAGSLPDDDEALCLFADLGRDLAGWGKLRGRVLKGWVTCNDGRLYHPFLCKQAVVALATRVAWRTRQQSYREKKKSPKTVTRDDTQTSLASHGNVTDEAKRRELNDLKVIQVPSLNAQEPAKGTAGHAVPPSRLPGAAKPEQPQYKQPALKGSASRPMPTDGTWRKSKEGIQAKAVELGLPPYDAQAAQLRKGPSWVKYKRLVLDAHAEACRPKLVARP